MVQSASSAIVCGSVRFRTEFQKPGKALEYWRRLFLSLEKVWKKRKELALLGFGKDLEFCCYTLANSSLQFQNFSKIGCEVLVKKKEMWIVFTIEHHRGLTCVSSVCVFACVYLYDWKYKIKLLTFTGPGVCSVCIAQLHILKDIWY